jgi:multidrug efflux pump subunit AcrB
MPSGSPYDLTQAAMDRVIAAGYQAVGGPGSDLYRSLSVTVGGALSSGFGAQGTRIQSELASATLELAPASQRQVSAADIERIWRDNIGQLPGTKSLTFESAGLSGGADVSFNLSHVDSEKLFAAIEDLSKQLERIDGVSEIETSAEAGKRELSFTLTQTGVAAGLTVDDLARQIRQSYFGEEVQRIQRGREEVRVYVRFPEEERRSLADLARLRVPLPTGEDVPLISVASVKESRSYASIDRVDGRRILSITADVDEAVTTPNEVNALIEGDLLPKLMEADPDLRVTQEGQARDQAEDLASLGSNLLIALLIMYVLLASVLRSYHQPLIILAIVPFGLVGSVMGHLLLGYDVSFLSLFGVVALCGVIVNDSIVLIDYYNELNAAGEGDPFTNIAQAVRRRFRPILLTTVTTFIGLIPMIAETSVQAQFLIPMALSIAFGILFASVVILFLVPACLAIGVKAPKRGAGAAALNTSPAE